MRRVGSLFLLASILVYLPARAEYSVRQRYVGLFELREDDQFKTYQDTDPFRRRTMDLNEIEAEFEVRLNPESRIELEVEFEHGGTGASREYEPLDESGEYENEVEKGGEVAIEEAYYLRQLNPSNDLIIGKAPLYISLSSIFLDTPMLYAATVPASLESYMLPAKWTEPGVQWRSRVQDWTFRTGLVAGLNSEFFTSYGWVGSGRQQQFETSNVNDFAALLSAEWGDVTQGRGVAVTYYTGNTRNNRYKQDQFTKDAMLKLLSVMGQWSFGRVGFLGQAIRGRLDETGSLSEANLNGPPEVSKYADIGSRAMLDTLQVNYQLSDDWTLFAQWEHVNSFQEVESPNSAKPRYDIRHEGGGFSHHWDDVCLMKFQYYKERTQLEGLPTTDHYVVQFGFDTGEF